MDQYVNWQQMLMVLAVLSLAMGNLAAIAQSNLKRMLAYSTISHMGFVLLGLLAGVVGEARAMPNGLQLVDVLLISYVLITTRLLRHDPDAVAPVSRPTG